MAEVQKSPTGTVPKDLDATASVVEAYRIAAVLTKCIEKLQLLSLLSYEPFEAEKDETVGATTGGTGAADGPTGVGAILDSQRHMEQRYDELLRMTAKVKTNPLDPTLDLTCFASVDDNDQRKLRLELENVSKNLKEHSRDLCRQLRENPNDANNWNKVVTGRSELITLLQTCVKELTASSLTNAVVRKAQDDYLTFADETASQAESFRSGKSNNNQHGSASYENFAVKFLIFSNEELLHLTLSAREAKVTTWMYEPHRNLSASAATSPTRKELEGKPHGARLDPRRRRARADEKSRNLCARDAADSAHVQKPNTADLMD
ncbi:flagellar associated protein [Diplonema papillatum]|nr:flagellar associated protein [Diplonema papillatum]